MYSQCAQLKIKEFLQITSKYSWFKQYMMKNILRRYDDELRIFLVSCLKKIDYLSDENIESVAIEHIAMHLIANDKEKGKLLIDKNVPIDKNTEEKRL